MPAAKKAAEKQYRVTNPLISLRQSPDPKSPLYEMWFNWRDGEVFTPPPHMNVALAVQRGIIQEV